jgi:lysophospholipase L1-like esterase
LLEDGLHLNVEGHRIYADVVQSVLDEWFHPPRS